jgi:hypothetical protein
MVAFFVNDNPELLGFAGFPPERVLAMPIWAEYFQFVLPKLDIGFNCLPSERHRKQASQTPVARGRPNIQRSSQKGQLRTCSMNLERTRIAYGSSAWHCQRADLFVDSDRNDHARKKPVNGYYDTYADISRTFSRSSLAVGFN